MTNSHNINHERYPILLTWKLPNCHVPVLATNTNNSSSSVIPYPTDFHTGTTKKYHPTTTAHQQEPVYRPHTFTSLLLLDRYAAPASPQNLPSFSLGIHQYNLKWFQNLSNGGSSRKFPPPRNKYKRYVTPIVSKQFP